ncbi:heme lyase CcmF/NrfE family subunit [Albibacterium bauzanense]|uniref:Cytochrome c-type biogenesis protein CcmF n=1 Tax=Albibacterium bauzanense TaxID=653929 RepID=A0A4R1M1H0_9SPHI|nr:cytochrome c biogenesis protein CcsA [Albibacterium bauzanense]TCK85167.1 cytochrome c-type biogenesis protein CcmF [Albibacterium bauzanense]
MDIVYQGENLLPGQLGQFFIVLTFGTALLSLISYFYATKVKGEPAAVSWMKIARIAFWINLVSVIGIGTCLYYIIYNHLFEYNYAWAHSSTILPTHYMIASFWEGQEGSFWLWMFWQALLGAVLVFRAKTWESPVMTTVMLCQAVLASMLIGVEFFGERVGSSPFILLRDAIDIKAMAPVFFADPENYRNYLKVIVDGNGLNPLLQNYWMVIHPPTLFLGFASMVVPFAYAFAGLWQRRYSEWVKVAMPWSLFAVMILGVGIIMGSFWAYEALNFGGFWAWDPVENASILPWFTLIAAVHVLLAYKNSGHSYFTASFLVMISFILVIYASFLTRSGILGETSVHSFTDLGMFWQLVLFNFIFLAMMIWALVSRWKELPITKKDEETYSREFWLFIGSMVLLVACIQIVASTSIPVFNAIFGTKVAPPIDPIAHYNKWQVPFAIVVAILSATAQFFKYRRTDIHKFYRNILSSLIVAIVATIAVVYITKVYTNFMYILLTFAAVFSIVSNAKVLGDAFKGKWKLAGSAVAHIGFALLLIGALVAASTENIVSKNSTGVIAVEGFDAVETPGDNLFMYINEPIQMGDYTITYVGDSINGVDVYYKVNYVRKDDKGNIKETFQLTPRAQQNPKMGLVGTPSTRHYLHRDIYTIVTAAPKIETLLGGAEHEDHEGHSAYENYEEPMTYEVNVGDTLRYRSGFIIVKGVNRNASIQNMPIGENDIAVGLTVEVHAMDDKTYTAEPVYLIKGNSVYDFEKDVEEEGLKFRFTKIIPDANKLELMVYQKPPAEKKWIVMKAIEFPFINFFWAGTIIMTIGFILSIFRRNKEIKE